MRVKSRSSHTIPSIDLIPMLNVMMGILAFFVMVTMSLANQALYEVQLPRDPPLPQPQSPSSPDDLFIVELNPQAQFVWHQQTLSPPQMAQEIQAYLQQTPQGTVFLKPNPKLPYEKVMQILADFRAIGGDRISLVID